MVFWRRRKIANPQPDPQLDQSVVIEKPSAEALAAAAAPAPEKIGIFARIKALFRRKPNAALEETAAEESVVEDKAPRTTKTSEDVAAEESPEEQAPVSLKQRLLAVIGRKWVWIPSASILLLALIGAGAQLLLQSSSHEKEALQAELNKTKQQLKKQLQQQAEQAKTKEQVQAETAKLAVNQTSSVAVRPTSENKSGKDPGDCVISTKESVAESLKDCIDNFNRGGSKTARKAP